MIASEENQKQFRELTRILQGLPPETVASGVGRKNRRLMVKLWKESGTTLSLKEWARQAQAGDVAQAWYEGKKK